MQKRAFYIILALCAWCIYSTAAQAKVWALPDYQESFSNRENKPGSPHEPSDPSFRSCSTYGGFSSSALQSGHVCEGSFYVGAQLCCTSSSCSGEYRYSADDCARDGKIGGGKTCSDNNGSHYTTCKCDTSLYPYSSSKCIPSLSGASCTDDSGTHYQKCGKDPCAGKTPVTCPKALGCAEVCGGNCVRCDPKPNCDSGYHWDDNLGCVSNTCGGGYATPSTKDTACGLTITNSHWELGTTTNGRSADSYCYDCILTCDQGYVFNSSKTECKPSGCPLHYAVDKANCGTVTGGKFVLDDTDISGQSGETPCKKCALTCNQGYTLSSDKTECKERACSAKFATVATNCGTVANGYYTLGSATDGYSGTQLCKKCEIKCNQGYALNANGTACELVQQCNATLTSCPKGYECTSCVRDGTTYYEKTGNCASGYAKAALGLDKETCYDTKCAYDNLLKVPSNATTISLEGGKIYVSGCKSGYFTTYSGGCIIGCVSKTEGSTCPLGSYASKTEACQKCISGVKISLDHSNTCYECCVWQLGFPNECEPCSVAPSGSLPSLGM